MDQTDLPPFRQAPPQTVRVQGPKTRQHSTRFQQVEEAVGKARSLRDQGRYHDALDLYEAAMRQYPNARSALLADMHDCYTRMPSNRYELYVCRYFDFSIQTGEQVLDIGSGHEPFPFATHLADRALDDDHYGRAGVPFKRVEGRPVFECDVEEMGCFKDDQFDFVNCSHVLEHVANPARACRELMRVAKRGYIETPTRGKDLFLNTAALSQHRWAVEFIHGELCFTEYSPDEIQGLENDILMQMHCAPTTDREKVFSALLLQRSEQVNTMLYWEGAFDWTVRWADGRSESSKSTTSPAHAGTSATPPSSLRSEFNAEPDMSFLSRLRNCTVGNMSPAPPEQNAPRAEPPPPATATAPAPASPSAPAPSSNNPNTIEFYDKLYSGKFDIGDGKHIDYDYEDGRDEWYAQVAREPAFQVSGKLLDVGCGIGGLLASIPPRPDLTLFGVDFSPVAIQRVRDRVKGSFEVANVESLPYPSRSFEAVVCTETLEHVDRPQRVLCEIARVLKPGGKLMITVPEEEHDLEDHEWPGGVSLHVNSFTLATLCEDVRMLGLHVVEAKLVEREIWLTATKPTSAN